MIVYVCQGAIQILIFFYGEFFQNQPVKGNFEKLTKILENIGFVFFEIALEFVKMKVAGGIIYH